MLHTSFWIVLLALNTPYAEATTFAARSFTERVQRTGSIVRGKAGEGTSRWAVGPDGERRIYTFTPVEVGESIKGSVAEGGIIVRSLGGEVDGVGMHVEGVARLSPRESVVVFLGEPADDGSYEISGMMMGKYSVVREGDQEMLKGPGIGPAETWSLSQLRDLASQKESEAADQETTAQGKPAQVSSPVTGASPSATQLNPSSECKSGSGQDCQNLDAVSAGGLQVSEPGILKSWSARAAVITVALLLAGIILRLRTGRRD